MNHRRKFLQLSAAASLAGTSLSAAAAARKEKAPQYIDSVTSLINDWKRKDIPAVLARVTDDIAWHSHVGSPPILGKDGMRGVLTAFADQMSEIRWRIFNHAQSDNRILLEGADDFVTKEGRRVQTPYMGIMVFRGKLIAEWRDYFDRGLFDKLKAGEPVPDYIAPLTARPGIP